MAYVAATEIQHNDTVIKEGDKVTKSTFSDDQWEALLEAGSVVQKGSDDDPTKPEATEAKDNK